MAMSKSCFVVLLLGVLIIFAGAIALVVIFTNNNNAPIVTEEALITSEDDEKSPENDKNKRINRGKVGSSEECKAWLRSGGDHWEFAGRYGRSLVATRETISAKSGNRIIRNAYWLTGDPVKDLEAMDGILENACMGKIPVVVIKMRPTEGLKTSGEASSWDFYKPASSVQTWNAYDALINKVVNQLIGIPALIMLEPDLLMIAFDLKNQQYRWMNEKYEEEFLKRAQRVIKRLSNAWVYVDAGNAAYLGEHLKYVDHMAKTLLRLPGLRGFSLNTMHFVNQSYNEFIARRLHCRTGLHYIVDTSRNGGSFSRQAIHNIQKCYFDPPNVKKGQSPGFSWGSRTAVLAPRHKRWISQLGSSAPASGYIPQAGAPTRTSPARTESNPPREVNRNDPNWEVNNRNNRINDEKNKLNQENNVNAHVNNYNDNPHHNYATTTEPTKDTFVETESKKNIRNEKAASEYLRAFKSNLRNCMSRKSTTSAHDANVWIKTPGEADGRLYKYGTYHSCLLGHSVDCDDECQMFVQEISSNCKCDEQSQVSPNRQSALLTPTPFHFDNFPLK